MTRGFPFEVWIGGPSNGYARGEQIIEGINSLAVEQSAVGEVGNLVVSGDAKTGAKLGKINRVGPTVSGFVRKDPCGGQGREDAPAGIGSKFGTSIAAQHPREEVAALVGVFGAAKGRKQALLKEEAARAIEVATGCLARGNVGILPAVVGDIESPGAQSLPLACKNARAGGGLHAVVLAKAAVVVEVGFKRQIAIRVAVLVHTSAALQAKALSEGHHGGVQIRIHGRILRLAGTVPHQGRKDAAVDDGIVVVEARCPGEGLVEIVTQLFLAHKFVHAAFVVGIGHLRDGVDDIADQRQVAVATVLFDDWFGRVGVNGIVEDRTNSVLRQGFALFMGKQKDRIQAQSVRHVGA